MPTATSPIDAAYCTREPLEARASASGAPTGGSDGRGGFCGLLLDPVADPWGDAGLLGFPAGEHDTTPPAPQSLHEFIATAYPRYGFHRWAELLIERLQAVADGELSRLIVTCPPRLGKSLLVSKLFPASFIQRHPQLFCAIASYSAELAYAHSREARCVPKANQGMVTAALCSVYAQEPAAEIESRRDDLAASLAEHFPKDHWKQPRRTSLLEWVNVAPRGALCNALSLKPQQGCGHCP